MAELVEALHYGAYRPIIFPALDAASLPTPGAVLP
jgi:hypothetical protein